MTSFLKNTQLFSQLSQPSTIVSFNGFAEKHDVFSVIEIVLDEDEILSINSTDNNGYRFQALLLKGNIEQKYLENLRCLTLKEVEFIDQKLAQLSNPAKIYEKNSNYILIKYQNNDCINLNQLLDVVYEFCQLPNVFLQNYKE